MADAWQELNKYDGLRPKSDILVISHQFQLVLQVRYCVDRPNLQALQEAEECLKMDTSIQI